MAKLISLVDDVDLHSDATQTIIFSYGRKQYEMDLCDPNAAQFDAEITWWIDHARPRGTQSKTISRQQQAETEPDVDDMFWQTPADASAAEEKQYKELREKIRRWGRSHGFPSIGDRGKIPRALGARWKAQQPHEKHRAEADPDTTDDIDDDEEHEDQQLSGLDIEPKFSDAKAKPAKRATRTRVKVAS